MVNPWLMILRLDNRNKKIRDKDNDSTNKQKNPPKDKMKI